MRACRWASGGVLLLLVSIAQAATAGEPNPGLWNLSAVINVEGAAQPYGPYYRSQCFSKDDLRDPGKLLSDSGVPDCSYSNIRNQGNRFDFTVQCGGDIPMSGQGSVTYTAEKFEGVVDITADMQGLPLATHSKVSGVRAGECPQ